ncbi:vacuolar protein sorting-associated protein 33B [Anopheles ziemanni]|uniref:vacuolar protein sorting-associated protein 33B n=1 Tax=Anopheles coustani TaxID=139045 RepID=UPI00265935E8|nr:vacuolar protein sorting-associated protein 33B [Anopheles coustani]XP_058171825.1 vacuolar protein sorting-associated protein 33B [Anopheles ziemanni]
MDSSLSEKLLGFRQIAQEKLQHVFYSIPSEKDLIIDPALIKPLEHVCGASWLRKKGIDKIFKFDPKNPPPKRKQFLYFISSSLLTFKSVLDQISGYQSQTSSLMEPDIRYKQYHVLVFPSVVASFEHLLEEEGLFGIVELYNFQWDFLLLDEAILSLELPNVFADVFVRNDTTLLGSIAQSLRIFNLVMGKPNLIFSFGENAEKILHMVQRIESSKAGNGAGKDTQGAEKEPEFSTMLILDRDRDYPACLLTPVVYCGLLVEIQTLNSGSLVVDGEKNKIKSGKLPFLQLDQEQQQAAKQEGTSLRMSGAQDMIYREHRYRHFSETISLLSSQAKTLGLEGKAYSREMKLSEMKDYVTNKLPKVAAAKKELFKHLRLCETIVEEIGANFEKHQMIEESILTNTNRKQIMNYIVELLSSDAHKYNTLRLICLYHVTIGLTGEDTTKLMTGYLNAFGYRHLTVFHSLCQARLFPDTTNLSKTKMLSQISIPTLKTPFQIEANKLKQLPTDANEQAAGPSVVPDHDAVSAAGSGSTGKSCPGYVFNGNYIPLVTQLTHMIFAASSFDNLNTRLGHLERLKVSGRALGGQSGEAQWPPRTVKELSASSHKAALNRLLPFKGKTMFIFVVGGITYAEIAACHLLERTIGAKIVLSSDRIIAGHDLIEAVVNC